MFNIVRATFAKLLPGIEAHAACGPTYRRRTGKPCDCVNGTDYVCQYQNCNDCTSGRICGAPYNVIVGHRCPV